MINKRILLLIEDDKFLSRLYENALNGGGYEVDVVTDGADGLQRAFSANYDLILLDLDISHPKREGIDVLKELKSNEETSQIPVLVLSNLNEEDLIKQCLSKGAAGYLLKTNTSANEITNLVNDFLSS